MEREKEKQRATFWATHPSGLHLSGSTLRDSIFWEGFRFSDLLRRHMSARTFRTMSFLMRAWSSAKGMRSPSTYTTVSGPMSSSLSKVPSRYLVTKSWLANGNVLRTWCSPKAPSSSSARNQVLRLPTATTTHTTHPHTHNSHTHNPPLPPSPPHTRTHTHTHTHTLPSLLPLLLPTTPTPTPPHIHHTPPPEPFWLKWPLRFETHVVYFTLC